MPEPSATAESPRVTVIIPTYNWSSVLPYSIGSVLRQTFTGFELLVVGDGCTDDSERVVTAIADPRVRWINLPTNSGHQYAPNNEGLRQARGSIIAYLGHDDLWLPHHLEAMVAAIDSGADVAYSIVHMIDAEGIALPPDRTMLRFQPGRWLPPAGVVHRRIAAERVGGWRDYRKIWLDPEADLWLRFHHAGFTFQSVPRLTAIKFPAAWRKDVYKKRSCHEQQRWTGRILNENYLEAVETGKLLIAAENQRHRRLSSVVYALLARTHSNSVIWLLFFMRYLVSLGRRSPPQRGAGIRQRRQFKGVTSAH
jgi:glycosyltransferase involved in cell wall biosynthesis